MAPTRKLLSLKQKLEIIKFVENSSDKKECSVRSLSSRFNVGKSCIAEILKKKEEYVKAWHDGYNENMKKVLYKNQHSKRIDEGTFAWFRRVRGKHLPISGGLIKQKALEIARNSNNCDFKASNGWLQRFLKRHNISFRSISGEAADVNPDTVDSWKERLQHMIRDYDEKDVYNADETGLFFRVLPNKTFSIRGETCCGGKASKERITILQCANMKGEKEKLLVIGKAARPRCFKGIDIKDLPVQWKFNKKAWMTQKIMTEWLEDLNKKMKKNQRKIILFVDNAQSHLQLKLSNVRVEFLPANTTSVCQPLDQGVIKTFKVYYRQFFLKHLVTKLDTVSSVTELCKSVNVLDAVTWSEVAWNKITKETIRNCFSKAGFVLNISAATEDCGFDAEDDIPLSTLRELSSLIASSGCAQVFDVLTFVTCDANVMTEDDIDPQTDNESDCEDEIEINSDDDLSENDEDGITTIKEAYNMCQKLQQFSTKIGDCTALAMTSNLKLHYENIISSGKHAQQSSIKDFFQKL